MVVQNEIAALCGALASSPFFKILLFAVVLDVFFGISRAIKEHGFNSCVGIDGAIRKGYLKNCTIEIHAGVPKVALLKKIAKDRCPTCGAPFTEVPGETYTCKYCRNTIKRVVVKK